VSLLPKSDTALRRLDRYMWRITSLCIVLILTCGGLTFSVIALSASHRTGQCVNRVLGTRQAPSVKDAAAHVEFALSLQALLTASKADEPKKYADFIVETSKYAAALEADQAYRDAHPLGQC
jgi:hypothetical protein